MTDNISQNNVQAAQRAGLEPMAPISYLEHLLIYVCKRMAGHQVGVALAVRLPGDGGLSLDLLRHSRVVIKCGADGHVQL